MELLFTHISIGTNKYLSHVINVVSFTISTCHMTYPKQSKCVTYLSTSFRYEFIFWSLQICCSLLNVTCLLLTSYKCFHSPFKVPISSPDV